MLTLQLGIEASTPAEFLAKAKEIVLRHKELDLQATAMQNTVAHLEAEQQKLVSMELYSEEKVPVASFSP